MTPADRREAGWQLAMLPAGIVLGVASALALVAVAGLALYLLIVAGRGWSIYLLWCVAALAVAARNLVASLFSMAALDIRATVVTAMLSLAILIAFPGWWLG